MAGFEGRIISDVEYWAPPQPPKRTCPCGTTMSMYNTDDFCFICQRKRDKEDDEDHQGRKGNTRKVSR